ncbi:MAG: Na/Pi cotransporter family protein [Christensenellales bacterium]|jgi:phosphate:Na+ symporter
MTFAMAMELVGGIALFLLGMQLMSGGLQQAAGRRLRRAVAWATAGRFRALGAGVGLSLAIQSSSAASVLVIGFVQAGVMTLSAGAAVMLGANLGATLTTQLIALNLSQFAPILVLLGVAAAFGCKKPVRRHLGEALLGFGLLFMGMDMMQSALAPLAQDPEVIAWMTSFAQPHLCLIAGVLLTSLIQSSSAAVGLLQVLFVQGLLPFGSAVFLILGCNIGTCTDAVLAGWGARIDAKRVAALHIGYNVVGSGLLFALLTLLPLMGPLQTAMGPNPTHSLANVHTAFKALEVLFFFPLLPGIEALVRRLMPDPDKPTHRRNRP